MRRTDFLFAIFYFILICYFSISPFCCENPIKWQTRNSKSKIANRKKEKSLLRFSLGIRLGHLVAAFAPALKSPALTIDIFDTSI